MKKFLKGFVAAVFGGVAMTIGQTVLPKLMAKKLNTTQTIGLGALIAGVAYVLDPNAKPEVPVVEPSVKD